MTGTYQYPESVPPQPYPEQVPSAYPGMLPPPVPYPKKRRRWPKIVAAVLAVTAVAAAVTAAIVAGRSNGGVQTSVLSDERARAAIQEYLTALTEGDDETVARHTLCGLYDAVKERRADLAVAGLAGDAFRKQFSHAEVTNIDKIVPWSGTQAQVLFTMRVAPAEGATRGQRAPAEEQQGVAQLLVQDNNVLVCSYVLRTGGQY